MPKPIAKCGTKGGFNRHRRTLGEEPCAACREAENAARRRLRADGPAPKKYCTECQREVRTEHAKCAECRILEGRVPCRLCGKYTRNEFCSACISDPTEDRTMPTGWVRLRPGGPLIGDQAEHNHPTNCTVHDYCDNRLKDAA
jgi:hypothetical protein